MDKRTSLLNKFLVRSEVTPHAWNEVNMERINQEKTDCMRYFLAFDRRLVEALRLPFKLSCRLKTWTSYLFRLQTNFGRKLLWMHQPKLSTRYVKEYVWRHGIVCVQLYWNRLVWVFARIRLEWSWIRGSNQPRAGSESNVYWRLVVFAFIYLSFCCTGSLGSDYWTSLVVAFSGSGDFSNETVVKVLSCENRRNKWFRDISKWKNVLAFCFCPSFSATETHIIEE